jgi:PAS domain-containing protein
MGLQRQIMEGLSNCARKRTLLATGKVNLALFHCLSEEAVKPNQHYPKVGLNSLKSRRLFPLLLCSLNANAAPAGFISFQVLFWTQYKWHIIGVIALCVVEALLILALLIQRSRQSRTEDSLRLSEEKFYQAFRSSPDALVIVRESDGKILEINDRWQIMLGYD